jgi:hypothetical protein
MPRRALFARQIVDQIARQYEAHSTPVLGVEAILRQSPRRPVALKRRSVRPVCHASSRLVCVQWLELVEGFRRAYGEASSRYRAGDRSVEFHPFAFAPPAGAPLLTGERGAPARLVEAPGRRGVEKHVFHPTDD